ncbi:MAG: hypothetical protein IJP62_05410 [Treponema sp.]|nr:hypothetical protein [Treponema sp.]
MDMFLLETVIFLLFALPAAIYDSRKFRVPLWYVGIGSVVLVVFYVFHPYPFSPSFKVFGLGNPLVAVLCAVVLYVLARLLTGGALGWGDVFFGAYAALYTGFPLVFFSIAFAALGGILFYLALAVRDSWRKGRQFVFRPVFAIPYVPFITFGALLSQFLFQFFF